MVYVLTKPVTVCTQVDANVVSLKKAKKVWWVSELRHSKSVVLEQLSQRGKATTADNNNNLVHINGWPDTYIHIFSAIHHF